MHWNEQVTIHSIDELYQKTVIGSKNGCAVKEFFDIYFRLYKIGGDKLYFTDTFRTVKNWFGIGFDLL